MLPAEWENASALISSMALWAGMCLKELWQLVEYRLGGCSEQWCVAYFLVGWYWLTSFACGFLEAHFWYLFVLVRHFPAHTSKISGNCFFPRVVARLPCILIIGIQGQKKFNLTVIDEITIQDFTNQPGCSFRVLTINAHCWSWLRRYRAHISWQKGACNSVSCNPLNHHQSLDDYRELILPQRSIWFLKCMLKLWFLSDIVWYIDKNIFASPYPSLLLPETQIKTLFVALLNALNENASTIRWVW